MTKIKTKIASLVFAISLCLASSVDAAGIAKVETTNVNAIKVSFSEALNLSDAPTGEIKVLKDIAVSSATKDLANPKVINLSLAGDITKSTSYSLISIFGVEGSMDFSIGEAITNVEIKNTDAASSIDKIVVVDSKRIDLHFKSDVVGTEFEFKILSGLEVKALGVDMEGTNLMITLNTPLESSKNYILMIVSLKDNVGKDILIDDGIFDFSTWVFAPEVPVSATGTTETLPQAQTGTTEATTLFPSVAGSGTTDTPAAAEIPASTPVANDATTATSGTGNIEEVAMNSGSTPDTGAETWVLILATLLINGFIYLYRRKA